MVHDGEPWSLLPRRVEIWRVSLDDEAAELPTRRAALSAAESQRAARFRFPQDRDLYILTRGRLRALLGNYMGFNPASVCFELGEHGKPRLAGALAATGVRFNVAHSGRLACIAITIEGAVGVDVEHIRPDVAGSGLAERFFSPSEVTALRGLPRGCQDRAFFQCWTRKEAYIKALGTGLAEPLDRFAVSVAPGEPAAVQWVADRPREPARWVLRDLPVDEGYVGAVAIRRTGVGVGFWQWDGT